MQQNIYFDICLLFQVLSENPLCRLRVVFDLLYFNASLWLQYYSDVSQEGEE